MSSGTPNRKSQWGRVGGRIGRNEDPERHAAIEIGLAVLEAYQQPGECITYDAMAEATGMTAVAWRATCERALKKMRHHVRQIQLSQ